MSPHRDSRPLSSFPWRYPLVAALVVGLMLGLPAFTDDTNLLRFDTAKPYVFIILDSSASMGLEFDNSQDIWTPGGGDGVGSRFYQAKQALYNTFQNATDIHFGFASFNQDQVRAYEKHWLYYAESLPTDWPIDFPRPDYDRTVVVGGEDNCADAPTTCTTDDGDPSALTQLVSYDEVTFDEENNPIQPDKDTRLLELDGHVLTFGSAYTSERQAGTCSDPLDLSSAEDLLLLQSFSIDGGKNPGTGFFITEENTDYYLEIYRPSNRNDNAENAQNPGVGQDKMQVWMEIWTDPTCSDPSSGAATAKGFIDLRLDPYLGEYFYVDPTAITDGTNNGDEVAGPTMWNHQDAVSEAQFGERPFTGEGWEGNYDSGGVDAGFDASFQTSLSANSVDQWCATGLVTVDGNEVFDQDCLTGLTSSIKPASATIFDNQDRRSLDFGDMIPFHWGAGSDHREDLLKRLAPNRGADAEPDFRAASYFKDSVVSTDFTGVDVDALPDFDTLDDVMAAAPLQLRNGSRVPLLALDNSPLQRAINDMRCWYLGGRESGGKGSQKCKTENPLVDVGWEETACQYDSQFGCRKPYLIIISDGGSNTGGENATADVSDLQNASGIRTWVLNLGDPKNCTSGSLHSIVQSSGKGKENTGQCIDVDSGSSLRDELESILGEIRTEARAFASAAVPTVQATVDQKIFLTNFIPFNDSGIWDGHVDAFLKPLPVIDPITNSKPDESWVCGSPPPDGSSPDNLQAGCFLWDAGDNLLAEQYDHSATTANLLGLGNRDRRRVFYSQRSETAGEWVEGRQLLLQPAFAADADQTTREQWFDLWDGFGITGYVTDPAASDFATVNQSKHTRAEEVIDFILRKKTGTEKNTAASTETTIDVLLGDIFHSTPQVVGTPPNVFYFAKDLNGDAGGDCKATSNENLGYRCFFNRHRLRRKMLMVGANDGQFHVFDAGRFRGHDNSSATDSFTDLELASEAYPNGQFDNGTGMEIFSYVPRMVLPTLNEQEASPSKHYFGVDGNTTVADVFIDPWAGGSATFPSEADREWRTVAIGSLREGGAGYFALDITQPDPIEAHPDLGFVPTLAVNGDGNDPSTANYIPGCLGDVDESGNFTIPNGCGEIPFPAALWEFTDSFYDSDTDQWYALDEDVPWMLDNDSPFEGSVAVDQQDCNDDPTDPSFCEPDLGDSWSTPNVGRIQICKAGGDDCGPEGADLEDRFVAIFGGGMDVSSKDNPAAEKQGNWLYMVDIETGEVLYKQRLVGAAPAEPAAVDLTGDGYFDRVYIGTLAGYMYRVDIGPVNGSYPGLEPVVVRGIANDGTLLQTSVDRLARDVWVPEILFDTSFDVAYNDDGTQVTDGDGNVVDQDESNVRPIYYRPAIIFQAGNEGMVVAFGTGDREDLWSLDPVTGRFYMMVDNFASTADIANPLDERDLAQVNRADASLGSVDLLDTGGWYLVLDEKERVITEAFALSGITIFSAYEPIVYTGEDTTDGQDVGDDTGGTPTENVCGDGIEAVADGTVCSLRGTSNIYVVKTTNADGLLFDTEGAARSKQVADFVTNPFTEQGTVKTSGEGSDSANTADELTPEDEKVMEALKDLFPAQCQFANFRIDIKTIAADTSLQRIASVPVCIIEHNWKEY